MIRISPGTMPTTARDCGSDSIPFETISAIISTATNFQDSVLYTIYTKVSPHTIRYDNTDSSYLVPFFMSKNIDIMIRGCWTIKAFHIFDAPFLLIID